MSTLTKYPYQIKSIKNNKRILSAECKLSVSTGEQSGDRAPIPPLETPGYSLFKIILIDDAGKSYVANLPEDEVAYLMKLTDKLVELPRKTKNNSSGTSEVYTYRFPMGKLKGKTAAEILSNETDGKELLLTQRKFLEANVSKFKANAAQIKIIDEAIALFEGGKLEKVEADSSLDSIVLYETATKYMSTEDKRGYHKVYSLKIEKDPAKTSYPYKITIMNACAPLHTNKLGLPVADMSKAEDNRSTDISVSEAEWYSFIKTLSDTVTGFRNMVLPQQILKAAEINKKNMEESRSK